MPIILETSAKRLTFRAEALNLLVDHIGILCDDMIQSVDHFKLLGFEIEKRLKVDSRKNLSFVFMVNGEVRIELVGKARQQEPSVIDNLLAKAPLKNMAYHFCLKSSSLTEDIERLEAVGYKVLIPPERAIACDNRLVVYLIHLENGLVELIEA